MKYKVVKKSNPRNHEEKKYYPIPVYSDELNIDELAERISEASTINVADVSAVLKAFANEMPLFLQKGFIIDLEGLGRFRMSFSATGNENKENVSPSNVTKTRIIFTPSTKIKEKIKNTSLTKA